MALNIAIEGKGIIANCDAINDSAGGTWLEVGGGTMSLSEDVFLFGDSCIGGKYAGKSGLQQYDLGAGNELDFDVAGNEEGQLIYMWISMSALGTLDTLATHALCIRVSSDSPGTSNYKDYLIAGNDDSNGWTGGFKLFVIDPSMTPSRFSGSCDIGAIRTLGVWIDCSGSARADSIFIDQIAVGSGLRITGTSTTGWKDVVDFCTDYTSRAWGMFQEREGIYYAYGKMYIGDAVNQSATVSFVDSGRIIQFGISEYYESAAWKSSLPTTFSGMIIEDHASYITTFSDGIIVGTDKGRSGTVFAGNAAMDVSFDLYGGNNIDSVTTLYGTVFKGCTGVINSGNDGDCKFLSVSFAGCAQFDPVGAPVIRNCIFAETAATDAALLWNENIDIQSCSFIANIAGAATEHSLAVGSPYSYTDLIFSGNTYDVNNTSGSAITVSKSGISNPSTYTGSAVTFEGAVSLTVKVVDKNNDPIEFAQTAIYRTSDDNQLMNEDTNASGIASESYSGSTPLDIYIRIRKSSTGATKYVPIYTTGEISGDGFSLTAVMQVDNIAS